MTRRRFGLLFAAAVFALLLALRIRNVSAPGTPSPPLDAASDPVRPAMVPGAPTVEKTPQETASPKPVAAKLNGLRLLSKEEAEKRGWSAKVGGEGGPTEAAQATMKVWRERKVSTQYEDHSLAQVAADLGAKLGLSIQIDPLTPVEGKDVSFRVTELAADQTIDLIMKMADLDWAVDPLGTTWITTKERAKVIRALKSDEITRSMDITMQAIRISTDVKPVPEEVRDARNAAAMAEWLAGRTVTVSIVNLPAEEAITKLAEAARMMIWQWSDAAKIAAAAVPPVSMVGENLSLADSLETMLTGAGVVLDCTGGGMARVETPAERLDRLDEKGALAQEMALSRKMLSDLRARRVRIEGGCLSLSLVLAQVSAQTAEPVVLSPGTENCPVTWESDGLDQSLGEVLDILSHDSGYCWAYAQLFDVDAMKHSGPQSIWFVTRE